MLLKDEEIRSLVSGDHALAEPIGDDSDAKDSQVQPSSLDLRIGQIYLPEKDDDEYGSRVKPLTEYNLRPGETAVIETMEQLAMPPFIAGIGFPPDTVSSRGLLMTNPGHVDPGYNGHLRFTVINMGRNDYQIRSGAAVADLLAGGRRSDGSRVLDLDPATECTSELDDRLGTLGRSV